MSEINVWIPLTLLASALLLDTIAIAMLAKMLREIRKDLREKK